VNTELPEKIRAFVAIYPPKAVVEQLETMQERMRRVVGVEAVRWTKPDQIHLTLQFLGYIKRDSLAEFQSVLERVASESSSFQMRAELVGAFPSNKRPRILWAGIAEESKSLEILKVRLDNTLAELGCVPEERKFHPHLTLGRVVVLKPAKALRLAREILQEPSCAFGEWRVREICFMQSVLSSAGANYRVLNLFPLKKV
jgi:RNA 2',3'-cyclic 3'-phosphodiesterase